MKVLVINCGSSTLKFEVIELETDTPAGQEQRLVRGIVEKVGKEAMLKFVDEKGPRFEEMAGVSDHGSATNKVIDWLEILGYLESPGLEAMGFRVVHGGPHFMEPTLIDD